MHLTSNTDEEEEEEEEEEEKEIDFGALKSLSDDGIDMSFLDALKDKYEKKEEEEDKENSDPERKHRCDYPGCDKAYTKSWEAIQ